MVEERRCGSDMRSRGDKRGDILTAVVTEV